VGELDPLPATSYYAKEVIWTVPYHLPLKIRDAAVAVIKRSLSSERIFL